MGDSDKLDNADLNTYTFVTHFEYIEAFFEVMKLTDILLVIHDCTIMQ